MNPQPPEAAKDQASSTAPKMVRGLPALLWWFVIGLALHILMTVAWQGFMASGPHFTFVAKFAGKTWAIELGQNLIVNLWKGNFSLGFPLMWLVLLQVECCCFVWWWVWRRGSKPGFRKVSRRLLQTSGFCYMLFLVASAFGQLPGAISLTWWPSLLFGGHWNISWDFFRQFWIGPVLVSPIILFVLVGMGVRLRRKFGRVLAVLFSFTSVALLVIAWEQDFIWSWKEATGISYEDWPWTHAIVLLGLANRTAALYLWTQIIELRVQDRHWNEAVTKLN